MPGQLDIVKQWELRDTFMLVKISINRLEISQSIKLF